MIIDLPISLKLLFNFSKQASSVVAANLYKVIPLFRIFANFNLLGYISEITTPISNIEAIIFVSVVFHEAIFTTRTSWGLLHLNQIATYVTLQMF